MQTSYGPIALACVLLKRIQNGIVGAKLGETLDFAVRARWVLRASDRICVTMKFNACLTIQIDILRHSQTS